MCTERGLTPRSSGAPTAGHQARAGGTRYIFASPGLAPCRRRPLSSNVRRSARGHSMHSPSYPCRAAAPSRPWSSLRPWQGQQAALALPPSLAVFGARVRAGSRPGQHGSAWAARPPAGLSVRPCRSFFACASPVRFWFMRAGSRLGSPGLAAGVVPSLTAPPNMSVNRTPHGKSPRPRGAVCLSSAARPGCLTAGRRLPLR